MKSLINKHVNNFFSNGKDGYIIYAIERGEHYDTILGKAMRHINQIYDNIIKDNDFILFFDYYDIYRIKILISDEILNYVNNLWNN